MLILISHLRGEYHWIQTLSAEKINPSACDNIRYSHKRNLCVHGSGLLWAAAIAHFTIIWDYVHPSVLFVITVACHFLYQQCTVRGWACLLYPLSLPPVIWSPLCWAAVRNSFCTTGPTNDVFRESRSSHHRELHMKLNRPDWQIGIMEITHKRSL